MFFVKFLFLIFIDSAAPQTQFTNLALHRPIREARRLNRETSLEVQLLYDISGAGRQVASLHELQRLIETRAADRSVALRIMRDKKPRNITVRW